MIETLLVLLILSLFLLLMPGFLQRNGNLRFTSEKIKDILIHEKAQAIFEKTSHIVHIQKKQIMVKDKIYPLENQLYCDEYEMHFNARGNVDMAGSFQCYSMNVSKTIIINLGSGHIYVK